MVKSLFLFKSQFYFCKSIIFFFTLILEIEFEQKALYFFYNAFLHRFFFSQNVPCMGKY